MPLEHYKTQVLLLHSQQSTLDALSAGFGDRYAVHLATSGSEALTTLGETPIHVIVSAQDLPGMTGLEALREAKKRSPDTIGILLAGDSRDDGLEALVSDQEVFQIVRGAVTPEALLQLVDQATKRLRLLTLAESANDQAANVDEPAGEHIVMETSENGAAIISDGSARMRALRAPNVQISSHVGGRDVDVLVLTKDEDFLNTIRESSRGLHNVHHANTTAQAEGVVQNHKVGVLVTDAAMAGSAIDEISGRLRSFAPRLVAIVAGRRDDGEVLMDLINRGHVYRFLLKPVSPGRARLAIEASVKHHLEAADSAFKNKTATDAAAPAAARPAAGRAAAAKARAAKAPPARTQAPKPQPARPQVARPAPKREEPTLAPGRTAAAAAVDTHDAPSPAAAVDRLDNAFGASGRFRKTMSGLTGTFGREAESSRDGADASGRSGAAVNLSPKLLGAAAAGIAAVIALGWWLMKPSPTVETTAGTRDTAGQTDQNAAETAATPSVVEAEIPAADIPVADPAAAAAEATPPPYQALLDQARNARQAGQIVAPPDTNAVELYVAARKMAPSDPVIAAELETTVNDALALAESALLDGRGGDAATALRMVRLADPQNARLTFLNAQVSQLELRTRLDQARAAIRESRFEDAATALAAAQRVEGADRAEIDLLTDELATARSEQQVDEVLTLAGQRLAENSLTEPANDNARYYYELALSNDAGNATATQGLTIVASKLVLRARDAIDRGDLDAAESALGDAGALDPGSPELTASIEALASARAAREETSTGSQAGAAASNDAAVAATGSATGRGDTAAAEEPRALSASLDDAQSADDELSLAAPGGLSIAARRPENPAAADSGARSGGGTAGSRPAENAARRTPESSPPEFVAISTLQRTNYVAPRYPRVAQRRGITGWVDVAFSVLPDGSVADIEIMNADPDDVFEDSATEAIAEWRFEPPVEDGMAVQKRVAVRMMFNLQ